MIRIHQVLRLLGVVLCLATPPLMAQVCPVRAPFATLPIASTPVTASEGVPVMLRARGLIPECPAPPPGQPSTCGPGGYFIQSCDTLQWTYGDGTSETLHGLDYATHTYAHFGLYNVTLHVSNPLGSTDVAGSVYVAASPSTSIAAPRYVDVNEAAGSLTVHVTRNGDQSRTNRVNWRLASDSNVMTNAEGSLSFTPGETDHVLTFPITSDHRYGGVYFAFLYLNLAADGAVAGLPDLDALHMQSTINVSESETKPIGSINDVTASKGEEVVHVPIDLSGAFAFPCCRASVNWRTIDGTAHDGLDYTGLPAGGSMLVQPETTRVFIDIPLLDNREPGSRTFDIELSSASFPLARSLATVTINDTPPVVVVPAPAQIKVAVAGTAPLTLSLLSPRNEPVTVDLSSSDPTVATVSGPAVISPNGIATVLVQGRKSGHTTIAITPTGGQPTTIDVEVTSVRRRAS